MKHACFMVIALLLCFGTAQSETQQLWSFDDTKTGTKPDNWEPAETNGKGSLADWEVTQDESLTLGKGVLSVTNNPNRGDVSNLLLNKHGVFRNIELSVKIKPTSIGTDAGGGLVWRAVDENHYYQAQWNAASKNLRLYVYIGGKPSLLESVSVDAKPNTWHQIDVVHYEETIDVMFDNESKISVEDKQLDFKGWVGLCAPGSATPSFDDVTFYTEEDLEE